MSEIRRPETAETPWKVTCQGNHWEFLALRETGDQISGPYLSGQHRDIRYAWLEFLGWKKNGPAGRSFIR